MTVVRTATALAVLFAMASLSACGGDIKVTCDEPQLYQAASRGEKIKIPDDLDPLDEFKEMPLPEATTEPRPAGLPCIDEPPVGLPDSK